MTVFGYPLPVPPGMWVPYAEGYQPPPDVVSVRYCHNPDCACAQNATANVPCWNCGGITEFRKPAWWPNSGTGQTVIRGDSYTVGDEQLPEAEAEGNHPEQERQAS